MDEFISRRAAIDTSGLDEEIRCEMCKNPIRTNRGCDGHCKYDEMLYEKIIQILNKRITPLTSAQPERQNGRIFQEIIVRFPISTRPEREGKPYFSIKYMEDGQEFISYGTYKPEVLSKYLRDYFILTRGEQDE